jgi:hypothetical protein
LHDAAATEQMHFRLLMAGQARQVSSARQRSVRHQN